MKREEFFETLEYLGFKSHREAGQWLGMSEKAMRRIASGELEINTATSMLLRVMVAHSLKPADVDATMDHADNIANSQT
jgi:hypothetical protein